jgi:hypothetical protein
MNDGEIAHDPNDHILRLDVGYSRAAMACLTNPALAGLEPSMTIRLLR